MTFILETCIVILAMIFFEAETSDTNPLVGIAWNIIDISNLMLVLVFYLFINTRLLLSMYKRHRLEFRKHACQQITCVAATALCITTLLYDDIIWFLSYTCKIPFQKLEDGEFCQKLDKFIFNPNFGTKTIGGIFFVSGSMLLPCWSYFIFNSPHDCFKCLGKDPQRNYSKF